MSKFLFTCLVTFIAISADAQISKNSVLFGGDLGFGTGKSSNSNNYEQKSNTGSITLSLGKAIKENTVVGFNVGYYGSKTTNLPYGYDTATNKTNGYNVGVFYRKYKTIAKDFYLFGQANAIYSNYTTKYDYKVYPTNNYKTIQNSGAVSITPGIAYKIFKKTFIELSLNNLVSLQYTHENRTQNTGYTTKSNSVSLSTAFSNNNTLGNVGLGFRFIL
jgi:hypothetical protein